jgi:sugar lactone lactonase YvrE
MRSRIARTCVCLVTVALNGACGSDSPSNASGGSAAGGRPNASAGMANAGSSGFGTSGGMGGASVAGSTSAGTSSMGGAAGSGGMAQGGQAGGNETGGRPAVDCAKLVTAPTTFETVSGFTTSEDFVFDLKGNYVGIDENKNLVRITKDGKKQLWAPNVGDAAGMGLLPDGSLVFCNVDEGALQRVHANGSVSTVLGGLLYPNGLELGPDGFVYVAENAAGRVRRVNVETGEFTVVAMGLQGPNGVAFSADPKVFYVGSFEGSGVYRVTMPSPGELGQASVFARPNGSQLKEPMLACPAMQEGAACEVPGQFDGGTCRRLVNVIDCVKDTTIAACSDSGCTSAEHGGGIDGLGVDACGHVYASEYRYGNLWRISPSGTIEKLATLPSMWVPNMRWGRGLGGFDANVLFVADRDEGRLFAVPVGVPAASSLFGAIP